MGAQMLEPAILTIGHSTHPIEEFIDLLQIHGVTLLADVRTVPGSRHNPQFSKETLPASLAAAGIAYRHLKGLGGLRHPRPDSPNTGWRNESFRGFADYMLTEQFDAAIGELREASHKERVCLMCAEAVPWRCHRSLIADALAVRGVTVKHIMSRISRRPHRLTPFAHVDGIRITYPAQG